MSVLYGVGAAFAAPRTSRVQNAGEIRRPFAVRSAAKRDPGQGIVQHKLDYSANEEVFNPFLEAQRNITDISSAPYHVSLARYKFSPRCEAAVNELINVEYSIAYVYRALFGYYGRDNVALPGLAKYFLKESENQMDGAQSLMRFQNTRGGRIKLQSILASETEFNETVKGDALYGMEVALSLQKLSYEKLIYLSKIASEDEDPQMRDFVDGTLLPQKVDLIKKISEYVSQLRRVGKGHGEYHFDQVLSGAD
ncbi:hypothetical protein KP509_17G012600 [Ceratopteris richardii]|uniref:Ferritin n=2 Tax=Ceratopteris richardii TaxID=49495 RepID=A0A8T2SVZ6_CERRI|nr:hypothetical protein KP509_17G012600 [Ceratopteris richardii]KAH7372606.1 hypothetical protein KP509_17G012600 [Ceratopteris richardii]